MKAWVIKRYGGSEGLTLADCPEPAPAEDELLVEIHAASVNPVDFKIRDGKLRAILPYRLPLILGNDLAGKVIRIGSGIRRFRVGDEIFARPDKKRIGAFAQRICLREDEISLKPSNVSMSQAASIPLAGLTAWQALVDLANLQPGQKVLIHAGSGGVGSLAIQIAKSIGAVVYATTGTSNVQMVKDLGADGVIDYRKQRFEDELREMDMVLDTLGGESLLRSFQVVKPGGIVVSVSGNPTPEFASEFGLPGYFKPIFWFLSHSTRSRAAKYQVRYRFLFMRHSGEELQKIAALLESGRMRPVIDREFPFSQVREALAYVETGRAKGKVVITSP